jgi:hypothetical protein
VLHNNTLIASRLERCITGVTRNPSLARGVTVGFDAPVTPNPGDTLALRVSTRIGTTATDAKCSGPGGSHNNATGLRLYYDSASRASQFSPSPGVDFYLHANGSACGSGASTGVTLTLNSNAPTTANAKCKDSGSLHFAGGNPYSIIGTWQMTLP